MIEQYIKNNQTIQYKIVFKTIKHVYFRKKDDYFLISANRRMNKKQVLSILDGHFHKLVSFQTKKRRQTTEKFQLWGTKLSEDEFFDGLENTQKNYEKILIDKTVSQIKIFESQLINDLSKLNLTLKPTKVKLLKSKFGSCQIVKKEITINAFLAKLDPIYLYYVLLHEYCHLIEANHSSAFYKLLDVLMETHKVVQKDLRKYVITF